MVHILKSFFKYCFFIIFFIFLIKYALCPIYNFPEPSPFSGEHWRNPYESIAPHWYKANFQVQSRTWAGFTDGTDKADQIYKKYRSLGYDIITISDYQSINTYCSENRTHIPVYEHGYNITKNHHVCIGATRVTWTDYIVGSNRFHKQHILGLLSKNNAFIAIAHPVLLNAFKSSDMTRLSGYDAIEVYNHYRDSSRLWDAALSAGKCVWAIGNDDSHDIHDERQTGVCWTMVNAGSADRDSILTALKNGRMIAVKGRNAIVENALQAVKITNKILSVEVLNPARTISFIGQQGKINHNVKNSRHAKYMLNSHDTYIRIEINNTNSTMLLNPIYRTSENDQIQQAEINWVMTWLQRFFLLFASSLLVFSKKSDRKKSLIFIRKKVLQNQ